MPTRTTASSTNRLAQRIRHRRNAVAARPRLYAAFVLAVLAALTVLARPFVVAHLQAVAVLDLVGGKPIPGALHMLVGEPVTTTDLTLALPSGPVRARLYTPSHHPNAPGFIVFHGVHYMGMDEPRLIAFAAALSSCGLRVLTPELPNIKDYHVDASSIDIIGDSAKWLAHQNGDRPVGVMGLSFSGSLALLAAATPSFQPNIKFVVAIGAEDEMSRVAAYYRTGEDPRPNGTPESLAPHEYGALVLEYENLEDFVPKPDQPALRAVLRAHLYEDPAAEKAALAALTPGQTAIAKLLMDTTSPITRARLAAVETRHVEAMAGVSPHGHLAHMVTPVYLLHGEGDNIIPAAETQWMSAELPSQTLKASLITPVLSHLDMDSKGPGLLDNLRLVHFFGLILHDAETR